ncbi:hypothetical protein A6P54_08050 [Bacillus sp. MKU004]|nr:hypothetical protein A6P54_08050 [Bacillus sp. MKU004]
MINILEYSRQQVICCLFYLPVYAMKAKNAFKGPFILCLSPLTKPPPLFIVQLQGLEAHVISQTGHEGKERLPARFGLCHPPLSEALPLFFLSSSGG